MKGKNIQKMNCLIVEDDKLSRDMLTGLCTKIDGLEIKTVETAVDAITVLDQNNFDLVFLDVEMPEMSGIDLIKMQRDMPPVIITSVNRDYAYDAFEFDVVDYLQKPISLPRLVKAVQKVRKLSASSPNGQEIKNDHIFIKVDGKHIRLELADVHVITSMRDYVIFQLANERHIVHSTLKSIEEKLEDDARFFKVHRSYIVNVNHIVDMDDRSVVIGEKVIPISRSNRQPFMEHLNML